MLRIMTVLRSLSRGAARERTPSNKSRRKGRLQTTAGSRETPEPTRERILNSAARLFAEQGFSRVSMPAIAEASGITAGAIYRHFASKVDLLLEVVKSAIQSIPLFVQSTGWIMEATQLPLLAAAYTEPALKLLRQLSIELATAKDSEVKRIVSKSNELAIKRMSQSIAMDQAAGRLDPSLNSDFVASAVLVFIMGLTHMETLLPILVGDKKWHAFVGHSVARLMGMR